MAERIRLEYDPSEAIAGAAKANKSIEGNERSAVRAGAAISKSFNESSTSVQRLLENAERKMKLAGASVSKFVSETYALKAAWAGVGTVAAGAFAAGTAAALEFAKANLLAENSINRSLLAFKVLRLAMAVPLGGAAFGATAGSVAGGIFLKKLVEISAEQSKVLERNALIAAQTGRTFASVQTFGTASTIGGRDLSGFSAFDPTKVQGYLAELEKIHDPLERARRGHELFGKEAEAAFALLGTAAAKHIAAAQALTEQLDHPTRVSIQRLRDDIKAFDDFSPFDRMKESLRQFREEAKQGITIKVAGVFDFVRGLGNRLGASGESGGPDGGVAFDSGNRPGLGIPSYAEFKAMFADVVGTSERFRTNNDGSLSPASSLLPGVPNRGGRGLGQAFQSGKAGTEDSIQAALKLAQANRQGLRGILSSPGIQDDDFKSINGRLALVAKEEEALTAQLKLKEEIMQADRRAAEYMKAAQLAELTGLDKIEEKRRQMLSESGKTPQARADIEKGAAVEQAKYLSDFGKRAQEELFKAQLTRSSQISNSIREMTGRQLEEQIRSSAEITKLEEATAKTNEAMALAGIDARKASELRLIQETSGKSIAQRLDTEDKIAAIERDYALQTFKLKANYIDSEAKLRAALATTSEGKKAILDEASARDQLLTQQTQATIDAAQETAALRKIQLVRGEQEKLFDRVRSAAEGVFDALVTRTRSFGDLFKNLVLQPFLTLLKSIGSNAIATLLTGGRAGGSASGIGGLLGGLLGGGGIARAGAPGGTGGFAGPVGLSGMLGMGGGFGGGSGIGGALGLNAGALGLGAAGLGLFGAFKAGQSDNRLLKGLAPGIGAASGLVGFGALASMFPALIAAGPAGWIAAAGIGATIGLIGAFRSRGEDKLVEKIKAVYGINVDRAFAKNPLMGIIKDQFGGDIDLGIRSPMVRDLLHLYKMQSGQSSIGTGLGVFNNMPRGVSLSGYGGNVYQNPVSVNGASYGYGGALPSTGPADPFETINNVVQTLAARPVAVQLMIDGRDIKAATIRTDKASNGRREGYAVASDPLLIFG